MKTCVLQALLLATFSHLCRGQCSTVNYSEQPPTELNCSPYDNISPDKTFILRIACAASMVENGDIDSFYLTWYRRRTSDGMTENLGPGSNQTIGARTRTILEGIDGLSSTPFSETMLGEYWCQAIAMSNGEQISLAPSNALLLLRPENYTGKSTCNIQSKMVEKCADINATQPTPPPTTTSLLPSPSATFTPSRSNPISASSTIVSVEMPSQSNLDMSSVHRPAIESSSSSSSISFATASLQGSLSTVSDTHSLFIGSTSTPSSSSSVSSVDDGDDILPVIIAASVASFLLVMIIVLMAVVLLMLCKHSSGRPQKETLKGGNGKGEKEEGRKGERAEGERGEGGHSCCTHRWPRYNFRFG